MKKMTYTSSGVDYSSMDPFKVLAQLKAKSTSNNFNHLGMNEIGASRGESAYVWEEKDCYHAMVIEGLGSKNLIADEVCKFTKKSHYDAIAQDTVAMIVNDLIVVGADPEVVNAYFAVGNSDWFLNKNRTNDLVNGWVKAVNMSGATWGGGETPTLKGIIRPHTIDLAGSAVGIIKPKDRLILGDKLVPRDAIFAIESNGIHANGLTLARKIASKLPKGYKTLLSNRESYGESLLSPTHIYAGLIRDLFAAGVEIHYMVNITGHGWRKIMRANREFSYIIECVPKISPLFEFIQEKSGVSDYEMYGNFNMGIGFVIFIPEKDIVLAQKIARKKYKWNAEKIGKVEKGIKQVIITPKNISFESKSLKIRN